MVVIRSAWYAVCLAEDVSEHPQKTRIHGLDYVLFRDSSGRPHALHAYCPHRGCDLSLGSVIGNELVCAFHGWRFNTAGQCMSIPSNTAQTNIPSAAKLNVYPVCDQAGFTWLYTKPVDQETETPTLELFPELAMDSWRLIPFQTTWDANFCRVVESVLDVSHLPFVHPETTGEDVNPVVEGPDYHVSESRILIHPAPFAPKHPMEPVPATKETGEQTTIELIFPNRWMIKTPVGDGHWMCTFLSFTPVEDHMTNIFGMVMRNFEVDSEFIDEFHLDHTHFVMNQDKVIVEHLRPIKPPELAFEAHVPSDGPTIRFRSILFQACKDEV